MKNHSMKLWFESLTASWNQKFFPEFAEVFTKTGLGYSFNMIDADDLLNLNE